MTVQCARLCREACSAIGGRSMRFSESRCFGPTGPAEPSLHDFEAFTIKALTSDGSVVLSLIKPS